ncbi:MAG: glycosyltransferase family 2 protein [Spirochaetaceae bacterium]|jgi:glycosyltransferase involved in cell wall biosynthesis|nr:glycosyltransferase family 2 protein [Spirochaetaceae bacterium]
MKNYKYKTAVVLLLSFCSLFASCSKTESPGVNKIAHGAQGAIDYANATGLFLIPFYSEVHARQNEYLDAAIASIKNQTDSNWHLLILDDASPDQQAIEHLKSLESDPKITVILNTQNKKQGAVRNQGILWASEQKYPFILFLDSDDLSNTKRLELTRKIFVENPDVDIVYSTFVVVDEDENIVPREDLAPSIIEIINSHPDKPFKKADFWIDMATEIGYTNLTSVTAVKTDLALRNPFPVGTQVSEDYHAWLAYSADGGIYYYSPDFPTLYRIPQHTVKDSARNSLFYQRKSVFDEQGIKNALDIYSGREKLAPEKRKEILIRFYLKQYDTFFGEKEYELADDQVQKIKTLFDYQID